MTKKQGKLALYIGQIGIQGILVILIALLLAKIKSFSDLYQSVLLAGDDIEGVIDSLGFGVFKYINNFKDLISYMGFIKFLFFINLILLFIAIIIFKANIFEFAFSAASSGLMLISYILIHPLVSFFNLAKSTLKGINFMNPDFSAMSGIEDKFRNLGTQAENLLITFSPGRIKFAGVLLVLAIISFIASIYFLVMAVTKKKYENVDDVDLEAVKQSFKGSYNEAKNTIANVSEDLSKKLREDNNSSNKDINNNENNLHENKENSEDYDKTRILNRDEIINKSYEKNENSNNSSSNSGEIKHGAYDFSSGFKKNDSYQDINKEDISKPLNEEKSYEDSKKTSNENFNKTEKLGDFNDSNKYNKEKKSSNNLSNNGSSMALSKDQKKYLFIGLGVLAVFILFFIGRSIYFGLKPDAEFDTSGVDIKFSVEGYSGYAKASAKTTDAPVLSQFKDKYLQKDIEEAYTQKITLDKEKNIKNGDVITATVEYMAQPPYKVAFSDEKIEKKFKVKGLDKFINSYKDLSQDYTDKFEGDIQKDISNQYLSDGESFFSEKTKNLDIELVGIYENKVPKDAIEAMANDDDSYEYSDENDSFQLAYVYKVTYDKVTTERDDDDNEVEKLEPQETVVVYSVNDISENNGAVVYNVSTLYSDIDEADAINKIKYDGFKKVETKEE